MSVKQPGTPLPWKAELDIDYSEIVAADDDCQRVVVAKFQRYLSRATHDAEYGAHAANAYPKLVEALRAVAEYEDDDANGPWPAAVALLRELGEAP